MTYMQNRGEEEVRCYRARIGGGADQSQQSENLKLLIRNKITSLDLHIEPYHFHGIGAHHHLTNVTSA